MVLDVQQVTEKVHKRHESRKKEVKQLFKMVGVLSLYAHLTLRIFLASHLHLFFASHVASSLGQASKMAQVSGSTNAEETVQGETGFSLKRLKNTMGIAQQKETIRKHHEQTKALTNELMGYAQTHHGKSKQEMIERHAIGKFPANASPSTATPRPMH